MKGAVFLFILLLFSITMYAQNDILTIDSLSFRYLYMECREPYSKGNELRLGLLQEMDKQGIRPHIAGNLVTMYLNDDIPLWRIGFPVTGTLSIKMPLQLVEIKYPSVVQERDNAVGPGNTIKILKLRLQEMGLHQSAPAMIRWFENYPEKEILLPIRSVHSLDNIIGKISSFLVVISVFLYLLFAAFLILDKRGKRISNLIFALFLFCCAMLYMDWIASYFRYTIFIHFPHLLYIGAPFRFIIAPLLFFYTISVLQKNFQLKKWHGVHLLPFIIIFLLWLFRFYRQPAGMKRTLYLADTLFSGTEELLGIIIYNIQVIGYLLAAITLVHISRRIIKDQQAAILPRQFTWLGIILYGFLIMNYTQLIKHYVYAYWGIYSHLLFVLQIASYLLFPIMMFYYSLQHPELFSLVEFKLLKTHKPSLSQNVLNDYKKTLKKYMEYHKPYLIADININKLAELVDIPVRSLSEVINRGFNQNFFEFINSYRIKEAKQLMVDPASKDKTILEILYEVGYNNKSVFNDVFKKVTGKTPKEYKAAMVN